MTAVTIEADLFLARPAPRLPRHRRFPERGVVALVSVLIHAALVGLLASVAVVRHAATDAVDARQALASAQTPVRMVFLVSPGPGGGGGGGGNRRPAPVPRAQAPGRDWLTIPVAPRVAASPAPADATPPPQQLLLDAAPLASGMEFVAGLPDAQPGPSLSRGPGEGGGVGDGTGTGVGSGRGPGMGPGSGGGTGGGVYRIGDGVTPPEVVTQVKPTYTAEALRAKIQGSVLLEVIVQRDGTPGRVQVVRSLDPGGLDVRAIEAVREWRFKPGRLGDTPVDVLVTIIMDFSVR